MLTCNCLDHLIVVRAGKCQFLNANIVQDKFTVLAIFLCAAATLFVATQI